jgi:hypothetical protein
MHTGPCNSEQCAGADRAFRVTGVQRGIVLSVGACTTCSTSRVLHRDLAAELERMQEAIDLYRADIAERTAERNAALVRVEELRGAIRAIVGPT